MSTIKDHDEKLRRGYVEKDSMVWLDGSEKLVRRDWVKRQRELLLRSGGRCERATVLGKSHVSWCQGYGEEPHHIKPRSKGRDDRLSNLAHLSHWCHAAEDPRKVRSDKADRRAHEQIT
jgi:hypothetical protein